MGARTDVETAMKKYSLFLVFFLVTSASLYAEEAVQTTDYPSPSGIYKNVKILNQDQPITTSPTLPDMTQGLTKAGLNIVTDYSPGAYTPGLFWSTQNDHPYKPKAGIWMLEDANSSTLIFGTSNDFTRGITNTAMAVDKNSNVGIGTTAPRAALDIVNTNTSGLVPAVILPRSATENNVDGVTGPGKIYYNTAIHKLRAYEKDKWKNVTGFPIPDNELNWSNNWVDFDATYFVINFPHNLNTKNRVVYLECADKNPDVDNTAKITHLSYGGDLTKISGTGFSFGMFWEDSDSDPLNTIRIYRGKQDSDNLWVRVRIWKLP